jgi:branched-subunit amino acid ABC-type transport system permease component
MSPQQRSRRQFLIESVAGLGGAWVAANYAGIIEAQAQWLFGPQVRDLLTWGLLFAVLALWPGGLLGGRQIGRSQAVERRV